MSKKPPSTSRCLIGGNLHEKRWTFWLQRNLVGIEPSNHAACLLNFLFNHFGWGFVSHRTCLGRLLCKETQSVEDVDVLGVVGVEGDGDTDVESMQVR